MCSQFEQNIRGLQGDSWQGKVPGWPWNIADKPLLRPTNLAWTLDAEGLKERSWSLIPHWSREPKLKYSTFNARAETLAGKPAYRDAWRKSQRCVVPASAYFEWPVIEGKKSRHAVRLPQGLLLGGLWSQWARGDEARDSFTIITVEPCDSLRWLHHRMPLILSPGQVDAWLHDDADGCAGLMQPREGDYQVEPAA